MTPNKDEFEVQTPGRFLAPEPLASDPPAGEIPHVRPRKRRETPTERFFRQARRNRWWFLLLLWSAIALPELILHLGTAKNAGNIFSAGLLTGPLFAVVPAVTFFILCTTLPNPKANYWVSVAYTGLTYLLHASQLVYYKVFFTFYSFKSMTRGGQVIQFMNIILDTIFKNFFLLLIMALPLITLLAIGRELFSFKPMKSWKAHIPLAVVCLVFRILIVLILPVFGGTGDTTAYGLYHNSADSYLSANKLGMYTAFRIDLQRWVTGANADGSINLSDPDVPDETDEPAEPGTSTAPSETGPHLLDLTPNVLNIDFDALIDSEDNDSIIEIHEYFKERIPSNKNEKTGLFKGCNLILITGEAFSDLAVSEELTPTLYKLMHEGYYFTDYYVPDWGTSTTDGEYAFLTGTIPKAGVWSFSRSSDNYMPLTMVQQLMKLGYNAYAYHGHEYDYYDRNQYLENLGYLYKAMYQGLDVTKQWPESDVEVVDLSTPDYVGNTPFTTYYMTISGHREFTFKGNSMSYKNRQQVSHLPYTDNVKAYLACQLELEYSMKLLLQRLEEAGVLDNTVIVLTADHYPNGLTSAELGELLGHEPESNFEIFKNGCIIWKQGMTPETIDEPCSHLDLLPTLSNLFGLEFDSRLYMGRDIFSSATPFVCFRNRSWITDKAMYNADTGEVTLLTDKEVSSQYIKSKSNEVNNRFAVSSRILEYDYWSILFD